MLKHRNRPGPPGLSIARPAPPITVELLDKVCLYLDGAVQLSHLARSDWRRQTDVLQLAFECARLFADLETAPSTPPRYLLVDGHINDRIKQQACASGDVKGFFNRRCHDQGVKGRRVIVFDTVTTRAMGGRGTGRARLHFHGVFELPAGWLETDLRARLGVVFGRAERDGLAYR